MGRIKEGVLPAVVTKFAPEKLALSHNWEAAHIGGSILRIRIEREEGVGSIEVCMYIHVYTHMPIHIPYTPKGWWNRRKEVASEGWQIWTGILAS